MIKASVFIATSMDGFIAREDGRLDWLPSEGVEEHGYTELLASIDGIVVGRKTFETVLSFNEWPYEKKTVVVLTSNPSKYSAPAGANCEFTGGDPAEIVRRLEERGLHHLYIDGGITIQRFLEAGLIQRLTITRIPVLLGSGIPLFGALSRDVRLQHIATRSHSSGLITSEYVIA